MCAEIRKALQYIRFQFESSNQNWCLWAHLYRMMLVKNVIRYDTCSMSGKSWLSRRVTQDVEQNDITS